MTDFDIEIPEAVCPPEPKSFVPAEMKNLLPADVFEQHESTIALQETVREELYHRSADVQRECRLVVRDFLAGDVDAGKKRLVAVDAGKSLPAILEQLPDIVARHEAFYQGAGSAWMEAYVTAAAVGSFFTRGILTPEMPACIKLGIAEIDNERYIMGINGALKAVERYCVMRGEQLDLASVDYALKVVEAWNQLLMQFDFRNSELRRSYDRVKWSLKKMEEVHHEVTMARERTMLNGEAAPLKKQKTDSGEAIDLAYLKTLLETYQKFDDLREKVIKDCRDPQKASKNAINSFHRDKADKGKELLENAAKDLNKVHKKLSAEGVSLRSGGSFSSAVEEFVEGFALQFLSTQKRLPSPDEIEKTAELTFNIRLVEYIGGLVDCCGEVMRQAVRASGKQDVDFVRECLAAIIVVHDSVFECTKLPIGVNKKLKPVKDHLEKVETLLYEMALIRAGKSALAPKLGDGDEEEKDGKNGYAKK